MVARLRPIEIPLAGVDKKTEIEHVEPGKLVLASNVTFRNPKALTKRYGYTAGPTGLATTRRVFTRGDELLAADDRNVFAYSPSPSAAFPAWVSRGSGCPRFSVDLTGVYRTTTDGGDFDTPSVAGVNGYIAICSNGLYRIVDTSTGGTVAASYINPVGLSTATAEGSRAVAAGTTIWVMQMTNVGLYVAAFDTVHATMGAAATLGSASNTYDACALGTGLVVVWAAPASADLHVENYSSALALLNSNTITDAANIVYATVTAQATEGVFVAWKNAAPNLRLAFCNVTTMVPVGAYPITLGAGLVPFHMGAVRSAASQFTLIYEEAGTIDRQVSWLPYGTGGAVSGVMGTGTTIPMRLLSRPWVDDGAVYVLAFYQQDQVLATPDEIDRNAYIYRLSDYSGASLATQEYHGAFARGVAAPIADTLPLPTVAITATGEARIGLRRKTATATTKQWTGQWSKTFFVASRIGIDVARVRSSADMGRFVTAGWGDSLFIAGACPTMYDGQVIYDGGHCSRPGVPSVSESGSGPFSNPDSRTFVIVWEWTDALDQLHRSAPSPPTTYLISGASKNFAVTASIIPTGLKKLNATDVRCAVYRCTATDVDNFFRCGDCAPGAVFSDGVTDASLIYKEPLYTNGGTLDNANWPPCTGVEYHQGRLWLCGCDDGQVWVSKPWSLGLAPEFNEVLTLATDEPIIALKSLDFALIAWSAASVFAIYGDPPNNLGLGGTLDVRLVVKGNVGLASPQSIVVDDMGVFFQGNDGIYLLDRGLQLHRAGAQADAVLATLPRVVGAVNRKAWPEIMFALRDETNVVTGGALLLYDTLTEQWATQTVAPASALCGSLCEWQGKLVLVDEVASHPVLIESTGYTDPIYGSDPLAVTAAFETPDVQVSRGGWQRVREIVLIGTAVGAHGVTLVITRNGVTTDTVTLTSTQIAALTVGEQLRIRVPVQRCRTMRVRVVETYVTSTTSSAGPKWIAVVFWVRPGGTPFRPSAGAQM